MSKDILYEILTSIIHRTDLNRKGKLKEMYIYIRKAKPNMDKEVIYDYCIYYYNRQKNKVKSDNFYRG
jgi:hypothetical protein